MKTGPKPIPIAERFWSKVNKTSTCWLWTGAVASNYGTIGMGGRAGKQVNAHRVSYELAYGSFDQNLYVLHKCDVPLCVRPDHLFLGTQQNNVNDMIQKGRKVVGYKTGKDHPNYGKKLPQYQRNAIRKANAKNFQFTKSDGSIVKGINLTMFCRDNNLNQTEMWKLQVGRIKQHRGYTR